jgi:prepilin-type N-terminal cleavage/methylation domain-containing protein
MRYSRGFTLLELLISLSIIGILSAIAIPRYADYKKKAFDTRALSDLRNTAIAEESYFIDSEHYLSCANQECRDLPGMGTLSAGVNIEVDGTVTGFTGRASHPKGTGKVYIWESEVGGLR